jgi:hypothetical protein
MKRYLQALSVIACLAATGYLTGCDREVGHSKTVDVNDNGTVKTKEKTVTQHNDGSTTVTEEKSETKP